MCRVHSTADFLIVGTLQKQPCGLWGVAGVSGDNSWGMLFRRRCLIFGGARISYTQNPKTENRKPKPETRNPKPETRNPKPLARVPEP